MRPLQVLVGDSRGLDVHQIKRLIEAHYLTPDGHRVDIAIGQGQFIDGLPLGGLILFNRKESVHAVA